MAEGLGSWDNPTAEVSFAEAWTNITPSRVDDLFGTYTYDPNWFNIQLDEMEWETQGIPPRAKYQKVMIPWYFS